MENLAAWRERVGRFEDELGRVVIGQARVIRLLAIALLARGHVLLEGDVGVGKTTLLRCVARALGGPYERVEGTIDLMPGDLVYHASIGPDGRPRLDPGPVLRHGEDLAVFFFNEINRARPQVHALLLRLMAERSVTAFNRDMDLPHLLVFADRNRMEREETFELPAAARDRFFMEVRVETPRDPEVRRALIFDTWMRWWKRCRRGYWIFVRWPALAAPFSRAFSSAKHCRLTWWRYGMRCAIRSAPGCISRGWTWRAWCKAAPARAASAFWRGPRACMPGSPGARWCCRKMCARSFSR
jgi:hypothetical protein